MWIIFGTKENFRRVPDGKRVTRTCDSCGEVATFCEKERTSTFRLYFIDVLDYRNSRVMQCGACGVSYATDELGSPEETFAARVDKTLDRGGAALGRAAASLGEKVKGLAKDVVGRPRPTPARRTHDDADLSDDDRAALDALEEESELEKKFQALEKEHERRGRR